MPKPKSQKIPIFPKPNQNTTPWYYSSRPFFYAFDLYTKAMASSNDGCGVRAFHQLSFWQTLGLFLAYSFLSLIPWTFYLTLDGCGVGVFH